ncbi:MAG: M48 family metallopeptidase [Desulfovibrio sp.]|nr:M48 family metallopeptidase [Desulfovibrio sp.]
MSNAQFILEVAGLPVRVTRKQIRNMYLRVDRETGEARLSAPAGLSLEQIRAFAQKHGEWLGDRARKAREQARPGPQGIPRIQPVWGSPCPVELQACQGKRSIRLAGGKVLVGLPDEPDFGQWRSMLDAFLARLAQAEAPALITAWSERLELSVPSFGIRRMKRRWGTCYPARKRIILNSAIAMYPLACLEAVIVHELLHFRVPDHGPAFVALLDAALPDWRRTDELLRSAAC